MKIWSRWPNRELAQVMFLRLFVAANFSFSRFSAALDIYLLLGPDPFLYGTTERIRNCSDDLHDVRRGSCKIKEFMKGIKVKRGRKEMLKRIKEEEKTKREIMNPMLS